MQHSQKETITIQISGMTCRNCEKRIERALKQVDGVQDATVQWEERRAVVTYHPERCTAKQLVKVIQEEGYSVVQNGSIAWGTIAVCSTIAALYIVFDQFGLLNQLVPGKLGSSEMGYGMLFVIGLMTSVHCIAMCGGINLSQSLPQSGQAHSANRSHSALQYNLGRVISYTLIGCLLGLIGMLIGEESSGERFELIQGIVKGIAGACMIAMGIKMLDVFPALRRTGVRFLFHVPSIRGERRHRPLIIGILNGLMPCGPLQSMQLVALGSGNPWSGALSMLFFSLGTLPLMLGFGTVVSVLGKRFAGQVTRVGAVLITVLGFAMLSQGARLSGRVPASLGLFAVLLVCSIGVLGAIPKQKRRMQMLCAAGLFLFAAAVWQGSARTTSTENVAQIQGQKQVVTSTLEPGSYPDISVTAGIPVEWTIYASEDSINGCNYKLMIPEYGITYEFREGENQITFTPEQSGTVAYSCWMGMIHGSIEVSAA